MRGELRSSGAAHELYDACVRAAFAKAIAFCSASCNRHVQNIAAFVLPAGLRGVCEDLIVLRFLMAYPAELRNTFVSLKQNETLLDGILVQRRFMEANNPFQPIFGSQLDENDLRSKLSQYRRDIRTLFVDKSSKDVERITIKHMAARAGLSATYDFIYFVSSNYVHFNAQSLLKTGWSQNVGQSPFYFDPNNMSGYYAALSTFYGTALLLGFWRSFSNLFENRQDVEKDMQWLENYLTGNARWPEVITLEEMNQRVPLFWLIAAVRDIARADNVNIEHAEIFKELKRTPAS